MADLKVALEELQESLKHSAVPADFVTEPGGLGGLDGRQPSTMPGGRKRDLVPDAPGGSAIGSWRSG